VKIFLEMTPLGVKNAGNPNLTFLSNKMFKFVNLGYCSATVGVELDEMHRFMGDIKPCVECLADS
jgi:hypothetical protein